MRPLVRAVIDQLNGVSPLRAPSSDIISSPRPLQIRAHNTARLIIAMAAFARLCALLAAVLLLASPASAATCAKRNEYCGTGPVQSYPCCTGLRCGASSGPDAICK